MSLAHLYTRGMLDRLASLLARSRQVSPGLGLAADTPTALVPVSRSVTRTVRDGVAWQCSAALELLTQKRRSTSWPTAHGRSPSAADVEHGTPTHRHVALDSEYSPHDRDRSDRKGGKFTSPLYSLSGAAVQTRVGSRFESKAAAGQKRTSAPIRTANLLRCWVMPVGRPRHVWYNIHLAETADGCSCMSLFVSYTTVVAAASYTADRRSGRHRGSHASAAATDRGVLLSTRRPARVHRPRIDCVGPALPVKRCAAI